MNSKSFKTEAEYTSPALKVYNVKLQAVIATSAQYGTPGYAGASFQTEDEVEY